MKRVLLVVVLLFVAGGLVVGAWSLFGEALAPLDDPTPIDAPDADPESEPTTVDPTADVPLRASRPWPFAEYENEIREVRRQPPPEEFETGSRREVKHVKVLNEVRIDISMKDAKFDDVVAYLAGQMEPHGVPVYTRDPPFKENVTFDLEMQQVGVVDVIREMHKQSRKRLRWHISQLGVCMGSWGAMEMDKREDKMVEARRRAKFDAQSPLLQIEYRPDFHGAHVGDVIRDIEEKTGVVIIVDRETWDLGQRLHWRTGPRPLHQVLDGIGKSLHSVPRVKDDRIFFIKP